jgi:hypothetical protein
MERKKIIMISAAVVAGIGIISGVAALVWSGGPQTARDPKLQTTESQLKYLASKEFGGLPDGEKGKYVKSLDRRELFSNSRKMSDEDKKQLRENVGSVFRTMMKERINKYSELSTKEEKNAYLDEMIDKMAAGRKERDKSRTPMSAEDKKKREERRAERGKRTPSLDRIKSRIETSDPKERAQWTEFRIDMRKRMEERGISMGRRGR